jgi:hypothetical protein
VSGGGAQPQPETHRATISDNVTTLVVPLHHEESTAAPTLREVCDRKQAAASARHWRFQRLYNPMRLKP